MPERSLVSHSEAETLRIGKRLGRSLKHPALILLQGELGAGKSVLARGIARGLGVSSRVPVTSPTFTLMNHYPARLDLYHFDLYRITDPDELVELGFDDFAHGQGVALVEWPERLENKSLPALKVEVRSCNGSLRKLVFSAVGTDSEALLQEFFTELERVPLTTV